MKLVDFLIQRGAPADWKQFGSDFICAALDGDCDVAAAVRSIVPAKVTLPQHSEDGRISAARHVEITPREVSEIHAGALYALGYRDGLAAARAGAKASPRAIGFRPH